MLDGVWEEQSGSLCLGQFTLSCSKLLVVETR